MKKHSGPTIMQAFSACSRVTGDKLSNLGQVDASGLNAVLLASWSEKHGDTVILNCECWVQKSANIWLATSQKK